MQVVSKELVEQISVFKANQSIVKHTGCFMSKQLSCIVFADYNRVVSLQ